MSLSTNCVAALVCTRSSANLAANEPWVENGKILYLVKGPRSSAAAPRP